MSNGKNLLTGVCPRCGSPVTYEQGAKIIACQYCDERYPVSELNSGKEGVFAEAAHIAPASVIDTAESGDAYIDNYFDTFDWHEFAYSRDIFLSDITEMVEKNKIKNGANPVTWHLEFKSIIVPVTKKIEGLSTLKDEMIEKYNGDDDTDLYSTFDTYTKVVKALIANKESVLKVLESDIRYFEKYDGDPAVAETLREELASVEASLNSLVVSKLVSEIPEIVEYLERRDEEVSLRYRETEGINAKEVYERAVEEFKTNTDPSRTLGLFSQIADYRDSRKYIEKINHIFSYNGDLWQIAGKLFTVASDKAEETGEAGAIDPKKPELPIEPRVKTFSLYEVVDGVAQEKPTIKNVSLILYSYGSKVFYFEKNKEIKYFDLATGVATTLDTASVGDYSLFGKNNSTIYVNKDANKFFIRKKLSAREIAAETKSGGCLSLFKKKKDEPKQDEDLALNNYSILLIDMARLTCEKAVEKIVDVISYQDDTIIYEIAKKETAEEGKPGYSTSFRMYDLNTTEDKEILNDSCIINCIVDGKIFYTKYAPNEYNLDLFSIDIATQEVKLIERNIYDYFTTYEGRIYYTVGNEDYQPLYSNNPEGTDRQEIMTNVESIYKTQAGWMYMIKGYGYNRHLVKMSIDGKKRVRICSNFWKIVKLLNGYIYYLDFDNNLHVVRSDGKEDRLIATDLVNETGSIIIDNNHIYYLRLEQVEGGKGNDGYSLYRMDTLGHNVTKLSFNILSMREYDNNTIYFNRKVSATYEIATPKTAKEFEYTTKTYVLNEYLAYDKYTEEFKEILVLGAPKAGSMEFKSGCFGSKKTTVEAKVRRLPPVTKKVSRNKAAVGAVTEEREQKEQEAVMAAKNSAPANSLDGCTKGCANGCASLGKK